MANGFRRGSSRLPCISPADLPAQGYVLSFDFGEARIGVAGASLEVRLATPLATITGKNYPEKIAAIGRLIVQWQPCCLVVGMPFTRETAADAAAPPAHALEPLVYAFGRRLEAHFHLPLTYVDERWTSALADSWLDETQTYGRRRKSARDPLAAMQILQTWLSSAL